jgi:transcriptional regulator with XRE-family HTH domain
MNRIVENLRIFREMFGYTQTYIADKLGISTAGYRKIETGETMLNAKKLPIICEILGVEEQTLRSFNKNNYLKNHKIQ